MADFLRLTIHRERLRDLRPALEQIGVTLVAASQKAFVDQQLGDIEWRERYPGQPDPFINVAGALRDLRQGKDPKARRYDRRPALMDTGELMRSVDFRLRRTPLGGTFGIANAVNVGSNLRYAKEHQEGSVTFQAVNETARSRLRGLMKRESKKEGGGKLEALAKLSFIFEDDSLETELNPRPFLGIPDEEATEITEILQEHVNAEDES